MKEILNLYPGLGGNRKLWEATNVTAVEIDPATAEVYQSHFPEDTVIVGDAHEYLLKHYDEFDFIWSSPPCPTHPDIRRMATKQGQYEAVFPDMKLYQEIILLDNYAPDNTKWVVENVVPYYDPLIPPTKKLHRHLFWSNFRIGNFNNLMGRDSHQTISSSSEVYGISLEGTAIKDKRKALRNMVDPNLGQYIFDCAREIYRKSDVTQTAMFQN